MGTLQSAFSGQRAQRLELGRCWRTRRDTDTWGGGWDPASERWDAAGNGEGSGREHGGPGHGARAPSQRRLPAPDLRPPSSRCRHTWGRDAEGLGDTVPPLLPAGTPPGREEGEQNPEGCPRQRCPTGCPLSSGLWGLRGWRQSGTTGFPGTWGGNPKALPAPSQQPGWRGRRVPGPAVPQDGVGGSGCSPPPAPPTWGRCVGGIPGVQRGVPGLLGRGQQHRGCGAGGGLHGKGGGPGYRDGTQGAEGGPGGG